MMRIKDNNIRHRSSTIAPFSQSILLTTTTIIVLSQLFLQGANAQFDNFPPSTAPCPSDAGIDGYTSIADMNADMQTELDRIENDGDDGSTYNLVLCPETTFDTSTEPLTPLLDGVTFSCGDFGSVNENCVISGGSQNVDIQPPSIDNYDLEMVSFQGITFEQFTDRSINHEAGSDTNVEFVNSIWQVRILKLLFDFSRQLFSVESLDLNGNVLVLVLQTK